MSASELLKFPEMEKRALRASNGMFLVVIEVNGKRYKASHELAQYEHAVSITKNFSQYSPAIYDDRGKLM